MVITIIPVIATVILLLGYRSSTSDFWSGAGAGYVAGRSGLGSSWGSSGQSSWGGGRSFGGSSFASTSRR